MVKSQSCIVQYDDFFVNSFVCFHDFMLFSLKSSFYDILRHFTMVKSPCFPVVLDRGPRHFQVRWTFAGSGPKELMYCFFASKKNGRDELMSFFGIFNGKHTGFDVQLWDVFLEGFV